MQGTGLSLRTYLMPDWQYFCQAEIISLWKVCVVKHIKNGSAKDVCLLISYHR